MPRQDAREKSGPFESVYAVGASPAVLCPLAQPKLVTVMASPPGPFAHTPFRCYLDGTVTGGCSRTSTDNFVFFLLTFPPKLYEDSGQVILGELILYFRVL
jgi:hypothetical protein